MRSDQERPSAPNSLPDCPAWPNQPMTPPCRHRGVYPSCLMLTLAVLCRARFEACAHTQPDRGGRKDEASSQTDQTTGTHHLTPLPRHAYAPYMGPIRQNYQVGRAPVRPGNLNSNFHAFPPGTSYKTKHLPTRFPIPRPWARGSAAPPPRFPLPLPRWRGRERERDPAAYIARVRGCSDESRG